MQDMTDQQLRSLLKQGDALRPPLSIPQTEALLSGLESRLARRRSRRRNTAMAAAAVVLVGFGFWLARPSEQERIALLETQVGQLKQQTDSALALVEEVLTKQKKQDRLIRAQETLAQIPDPLAEMQAMADRTAFTMLYQADRLYRELNLRQDAVEVYQRLIGLFPDNRWAKVARERLEEIRNEAEG